MIREDYWAVIYDGQQLIGYTSTFQEADDVCKKNNNYSWDLARRVIKSKQKRTEMFNQLEQITI